MQNFARSVSSGTHGSGWFAWMGLCLGGHDFAWRELSAPLALSAAGRSKSDNLLRPVSEVCELYGSGPEKKTRRNTPGKRRFTIHGSRHGRQWPIQVGFVFLPFFCLPLLCALLCHTLLIRTRESTLARDRDTCTETPRTHQYLSCALHTNTTVQPTTRSIWGCPTLL